MNKKDLTEADIRTKFITPALVGSDGSKWNVMTQLREEVSFTNGRVIVRGKTVTRGEKRKVDYLLFYKPNLPIAVVEAKDNNHSVGAGMAQAIAYAESLDVPFAYTSNGDAFLEHDRTATSGVVEREIPLDQFAPLRIALLEQGFVYASVNMRGGSEYGEAWHDAGTKLKKQNVFDDFIASAEWLIANKYTNPSKLAAQGGSNGGLLVGAVINQRPDLFRVAIPQVGVMDMLRFHKFTIGWNWIADYGSSDNAEEFKALRAYSPLHNVRPIKYPATLVTTADHDDRVVPAHSFKYAATMQKIASPETPVLIRIDTKSGHGASNVTKQIEATADIYAFIMFNLGVTPKF